MAGTATFVLQCLCGVPEGNRSSFEEIYCWVRYLGVSEELLTERSIQCLLSARSVWLVGNAGSYGRGSASNGIDKFSCFARERISLGLVCFCTADGSAVLLRKAGL